MGGLVHNQRIAVYLFKDEDDTSFQSPMPEGPLIIGRYKTGPLAGLTGLIRVGSNFKRYNERIWTDCHCLSLRTTEGPLQSIEGERLWVLGVIEEENSLWVASLDSRRRHVLKMDAMVFVAQNKFLQDGVLFYTSQITNEWYVQWPDQLPLQATVKRGVIRGQARIDAARRKELIHRDWALANDAIPNSAGLPDAVAIRQVNQDLRAREITHHFLHTPLTDAAFTPLRYPYVPGTPDDQLSLYSDIYML